MAAATFTVSPDSAFFSIRQTWLEREAKVSPETIDAEGLTTLHLDTIVAYDDGYLAFTSDRLERYSDTKLSFSLLDAIDFDAYTESSPAIYHVFLAMFGDRESFTCELDCEVVVQVRSEFGGGITAIDGVRWNQDSDIVELRWAGEVEWFELSQVVDNAANVFALIHELVYSLSRKLVNAS